MRWASSVSPEPNTPAGTMEAVRPSPSRRDQAASRGRAISASRRSPSTARPLADQGVIMDVVDDDAGSVSLAPGGRPGDPHRNPAASLDRPLLLEPLVDAQTCLASRNRPSPANWSDAGSWPATGTTRWSPSRIWRPGRASRSSALSIRTAGDYARAFVIFFTKCASQPSRGRKDANLSTRRREPRRDSRLRRHPSPRPAFRRPPKGRPPHQTRRRIGRRRRPREPPRPPYWEPALHPQMPGSSDSERPRSRRRDAGRPWLDVAYGVVGCVFGWALG